MISPRASRLAVCAFLASIEARALGVETNSALGLHPEQHRVSPVRLSQPKPDELAPDGEGIAIRRALSGLVTGQGCRTVNKTALTVYCSRIGENNYAGVGLGV